MVNCIKFWASWKKKCLTNFDKVLRPIWKTFLWLKQLFDVKLVIIFFQCSKNYNSPTRATGLKVPPIVADQISMHENRP